MRDGGNEQSLKGSVLSVAERQKLHEKKKTTCPGERLTYKRMLTRVYAHTHVCPYTN